MIKSTKSDKVVDLLKQLVEQIEDGLVEVRSYSLEENANELTVSFTWYEVALPGSAPNRHPDHG